jgi:hypothetical protein
MNDHVATDTESLCEDIEPSAAGTLGEVVAVDLVVRAWRVDEQSSRRSISTITILTEDQFRAGGHDC